MNRINLFYWWFLKIRQIATNIAQEIESWSEKFTRLTIIEQEDDEYAFCCYEDPQISKVTKKLDYL